MRFQSEKKLSNKSDNTSIKNNFITELEHKNLIFSSLNLIFIKLNYFLDNIKDSIDKLLENE